MEKVIIDHQTLKRTLRRLAYEIIENTKDLQNVVLLGIKTKGIRLAEIIQENIEHIEGVQVGHYTLDITPYRDDMTTDIPKSINKEYVTEDLAGKIVILVDDVLYTGRTIRAAMDAVIELGRPEVIQLAVLIDRGHRQLPIKANFVGKNIPTSKQETIKTYISDLGEQDKVLLIR